MAVVCLSVCPMPDPKLKTEGHSKLKIGREEAHDTGDKMQGQGHQAVLGGCSSDHVQRAGWSHYGPNSSLGLRT